MTTKGKPTMEKTIGEDDMKGLEEEIDSAVDRLFVEEKRPGRKRTHGTSDLRALSRYSWTVKASIGRAPPIRTRTPSFLKSFEKMETQLLSLEWEITKENLEKTREEVGLLRKISKGRPDITSVLNLMEKVLIHMIRNEENINPPMIKFLLDSKETIKLLMKKETDSEIHIYKQLAFGIEARFLCLGRDERDEGKAPSSNVSEEVTRQKCRQMWGQTGGGNLEQNESIFSKDG